ncbi:hypothetical protein EH221_04435 [bacterium]|nr:MAG: hypothetical protein EH221_04435 [bacterium]
MVKWKSVPQFAFIFVLFFLTACTSVFWDKQWQFDDLDRGIKKSQKVRITSNPSSSLEINGTYIGKTPQYYDFKYNENHVYLKKYKYEKKFMGEETTVEKKDRVESITESFPYLLHFQASGYHDLYLPISIPYSKDGIEVNLEKAGIINNIECRIHVEARRRYFNDFIVQTIAKYAVQKDKVIKTPKDPMQIGGQDIYSQTFVLIVKDSIAFDGLVNSLLAEAKKKDFVFEILNAKTEATFSTNVMETGITHLVSGRTRSGSNLFLVQGAGITKIELDERGTYSFPVRLKQGENYVYLISRYLGINVYNRINVHSQEEEELSEENFLKNVSVSKGKMGEILSRY